jgi:signal transduction histidine kinase
MDDSCKREGTWSISLSEGAIGKAFGFILFLSILLIIGHTVQAYPQSLTGTGEDISQSSSTAVLSTWESPLWLKWSVAIGVSLLLILIILSFILRDEIEKKTMELNSKNRQLQIEIRERKAAEDKLKNYSAQLKDSNELKDLFTDVLRHDLINPASVIKGYVEYLLENEKDAKRTAALKTIERNNLKLIQMIENAANLAKLENVEELNFEKMDLRDIIDEVVQGLQPQAEEKNMCIEFRQEGNYPAQVNRIVEEVFSNLISNSIKYSPAASKITVKVCALKDIYWKISVYDNGIGISDEDKPYIFDRFKRVGKTNIQGTGLGLAIAKRIIELHEGQIGVEDNPSGKGTVFWVTLHRHIQ